MIYLYLGYITVGLFILLGISIQENLTLGQYGFVVAFSLIQDFIPIIPYLLGRKLSKTARLHWFTLLFSGFAIAIFTQVLLPAAGLAGSKGGNITWVSAILCFGVAFIPAKIKIWRQRPKPD